MSRFPLSKRVATGHTRAGLVALTGAILVIAAVPIFKYTQERFSTDKIEAAMKEEGQQAVDAMAEELSHSRRLFGDNRADTAFLERIARTDAPPMLPGSRLPLSEDKARAFATVKVGNHLFFARGLDAVTLETGEHIDVHRFQSYFLALDETKHLRGAPRRELWEWRSVRFADQRALTALPDVKTRNAALTKLVAEGITHAWDPSASQPSKAFFILTSTGVLADPAARLPEESARRMIRITAAMVRGGYRHGVAPNDDGKTRTPHPVPKFATPAADFPSGFEVVVTGPKVARQVFMRLVLAAQGRFSGNITTEQVTLVTIRDLL